MLKYLFNSKKFKHEHGLKCSAERFSKALNHFCAHLWLFLNMIMEYNRENTSTSLSTSRRWRCLIETMSSNIQVWDFSGFLKIVSWASKNFAHQLLWLSSKHLELKNFGMSSFSLFKSIFSADGVTKSGTPQGTFPAYRNKSNITKLMLEHDIALG